MIKDQSHNLFLKVVASSLSVFVIFYSLPAGLAFAGPEPMAGQNVAAPGVEPPSEEEIQPEDEKEYDPDSPLRPVDDSEVEDAGSGAVGADIVAVALPVAVDAALAVLLPAKPDPKPDPGLDIRDGEKKPLGDDADPPAKKAEDPVNPDKPEKDEIPVNGQKDPIIPANPVPPPRGVGNPVDIPVDRPGIPWWLWPNDRPNPILSDGYYPSNRLPQEDPKEPVLVPGNPPKYPEPVQNDEPQAEVITVPESAPLPNPETPETTPVSLPTSLPDPDPSAADPAEPEGIDPATPDQPLPVEESFPSFPPRETGGILRPDLPPAEEPGNLGSNPEGGHPQPRVRQFGVTAALNYVNGEWVTGNFSPSGRPESLEAALLNPLERGYTQGPAPIQGLLRNDYWVAETEAGGVSILAQPPFEQGLIDMLSKLELPSGASVTGIRITLNPPSRTVGRIEVIYSLTSEVAA